MRRIQSSAEIVVILKPEATHDLTVAVQDKYKLIPIFGATQERVAASMSPAVLLMASPELNPALFYHVAGVVSDPQALIEKLLKEPDVSGAYFKPPSETPEMYREEAPEEGPPLDLSPNPTPDFNKLQRYLQAAPEGIDALFAWTKLGGRGDTVRLIDLEWGWNFSHEDLLVSSGGLLDGVNDSDTDHGTAVIGVIGGDNNGTGIVGIAPNASVSTISFVGNTTSQAIRKAADRLSAGDIILLEVHRAGPLATGAGQEGYIAIEWWPDDFVAILYATSKGVIVVEAAGNGAQNLDDLVYNHPQKGFPPAWSNPFNRANPQCGAILVGAGAPPPGTHGKNHGVDRSRLEFSNFGTAVDVQGWGREVTTSGRSWGVADLHNGGGNAWYTNQFSGTSSASPIVVGALACAQGWLRAAGKSPMTSVHARNLLRATGSPQQDEIDRPASQRIGNRPDLRRMYARLFP